MLGSTGNFIPIGIKQPMAPVTPGSNISTPERLTAIRAAPKYINPGGNLNEKKYQQKEYKAAHPQGYAEGGVVGPSVADAALPYAQKGAQYMRKQVGKIVTDQGNPFSQKANQQEQYDNDKLTPSE
jgi:hypothetical protein